jgi:magnesium transporter
MTVSHSAPLFLRLSPAEQFSVLHELPQPEQLVRMRMRMLPLADVADLIQAAPDARRDELLGLLYGAARSEVRALLAYAEDVAGGLMNPRFVRLRSDSHRRSVRTPKVVEGR